MSADQTIPLPNVTRIEVIDSTGRAFTRYYELAGCTIQTQDGGRTLKVFANVPEGDPDPNPQPRPEYCRACGRSTSNIATLGHFDHCPLAPVTPSGDTTP